MTDIIITKQNILESMKAIEAANKLPTVRSAYEALRLPTFRLTPRNMQYGIDPFDTHQRAYLWAYGAYLWPKAYEGATGCFDWQHARDKFFFDAQYAADPALDYTVWEDRRLAPRVHLEYDLSSLGPNKKLKLDFEYEALTESRVLIYTYQRLLGDQTLVRGDNRFSMEVETLDWASLIFIHAGYTQGSLDGGNWSFKSISGYVV